MASLVEIDRNPSLGKLRWFGILLAIFCVVTGGMVHWHLEAPKAAITIWALGGGLVIVYLSVPTYQRWIYLGWLYMTFPLGWGISHLVLAAFFYLLLTPIGFAMRIFKGDPLQRRLDRKARSYWEPRQQRDKTQQYFRQY